MSITRRFAKLMITLWLFLSVLAPACAEEPAVHFSTDNRLNILIVADTQDIENPQQAMLSLLNASLDTAKPDLVIFLGDMIHGRVIRGEENVRKAIDAVVSPVVERNIPFALVFAASRLVTRDFPTPPLPLTTPITCFTEDSLFRSTLKFGFGGSGIFLP